LAARTLGTVAWQLAGLMRRKFVIAAWCVPHWYRRERDWSLSHRRLVPHVGDVRQRAPDRWQESRTTSD